MRTLTVLALLAALPAFAGTSEDLDRYLTARTGLGQFSGAALVIHDGDVVLRKGYGYASLVHRAANTPETRFEIASLTKAFTATAAWELAREGRLPLDGSICRWMERCPESWKSVTVAHLIRHRSGIPDYEDALEMGSAKYEAALRQPESAAAMIDWARHRPLDFAPGSKFSYSNTGYLILGMILESVSGKGYEALLRERIFEPLSMHRTEHIDRERVQNDLAEGYTHEAPLEVGLRGFPLDGGLLRHVPLLRQDPPQADGGLISSVDDLEKWVRMFFSDDPAARAKLAALLAPEDGYAFGWRIGERFGKKRIFHTGVLPGMVSAIEIYPETRSAVVWLGNLDRIRMANVTRDLAAIVFGEPFDIPRSHPTQPFDAARAAPLLGEYRFADGDVMTIRHNAERGWLEASIPDRFTAGALAESDRVFFAPFWEGTLTFAPDASFLVMRQSGTDQRAERITAADAPDR